MMLTNHQRILVALDLEGDRDAAFEWGLALARTSGAELYLLYTFPGSKLYAHGVAERLHRARDLRTRAEAAGVTVRVSEEHGNPAEIILLHAEARAVDLIVIATERPSGWTRWRRRSVANTVLRRTTRPTLVVRGDDAGEPAFANVLVAVDLKPGSMALIDTARRLIGSDSQHLNLMHAVDVVDAGDAWMVPEYGGHVLDKAQRRLEAVASATLGADPAVHVAAGPVADAVSNYAADLEADVIVVGARKRVLSLGSAAGRILRQTKGALLVIPMDASAQSNDIVAAACVRAA